MNRSKFKILEYFVIMMCLRAWHIHKCPGKVWWRGGDNLVEQVNFEAYPSALHVANDRSSYHICNCFTSWQHSTNNVVLIFTQNHQIDCSFRCCRDGFMIVYRDITQFECLNIHRLSLLHSLCYRNKNLNNLNSYIYFLDITGA